MQIGDDNLPPVVADCSSLAGMRVLALFGGSEMFGHERANIEVFRTLAEFGTRVRFLVDTRYGNDSVTQELEKYGFDWVPAPFGYLLGKSMFGRQFHHSFINSYSFCATSVRLWRETRWWRPTHFYTSTWRYFIYAMPAMSFLKPPLIYRAGDCLPAKRGVHRWTNRALFSRASCVVCNSVFVQNNVLEAGAFEGRLRVIYNLPPERKNASTQVFPPKTPGDVIICYVGQLSDHKGIFVLLNAMRLLHARGSKASLWVAGKPSWKSGVVDRIQEHLKLHGLHGTVRLLGYVDDVPALMRLADLHVCPSVFQDPSPNVILEAKREAVPTIGFPVGGIPELIDHKVDGYLCHSTSPEALVEGLDYFLSSPERRRKAGLAARQCLGAKFGPLRFQHQWAEVFTSTMLPPTANKE